MAPAQSTFPAVGKLETLDKLREEFKFNKSFGEKVKQLEKLGYDGWRRMRGDGNCFYRAVGFGLLEVIVEAPQQLQRKWAQHMSKAILALRFNSEADQRDHDRLCKLIGKLAEGTGWQQVAELEDSFTDSSLDQALVRAVRHLIGKCMVENADDEALGNGMSFRLLCEVEGQSLEGYLSTKILKMGVEAEGHIIKVTTEALRINLHIVYLDRHDGVPLRFENVDALDAEDDELPVVNVQLRPGHYDGIHLPRNKAAGAAAAPPKSSVASTTPKQVSMGRSTVVEQHAPAPKRVTSNLSRDAMRARRVQCEESEESTWGDYICGWLPISCGSCLTRNERQ
eukprot:gb/GFBE01066895.1/.p1 GENE.gb/GFBE01066895.1/~~gb/GFBE01066895.1/.p1  ORF type:complete len:339 (+),score=87.53 gb/GFBE01066895.1/:1-1017(+)